MRLLRIMRLVRLVKSVKPLYRLIVGVVASLNAMKWVLVLTVIVLYAAAILFTTLVGKGYLYAGRKAPKLAADTFGTVTQSLFSLFRVMNGDIDIVAPICDSITGRLLFMCFMVLSNWAILAILTSVVSDNMISSSVMHTMEEEALAKEEARAKRQRRLYTLFKEVDHDGDECI